MIFVIEKGYIKNLERLDKTIASYKKIVIFNYFFLDCYFSF